MKSLVIALLILFSIIIITSISSSNPASFIFAFIILVVMLLLGFVEYTRTIDVFEDKIVMQGGTFFNKKEIVFETKDIVKFIFHRQTGRYDSDSLKIVFKNGKVKKFALSLDMKIVFALLEKLKNQGFIVQFDN